MSVYLKVDLRKLDFNLNSLQQFIGSKRKIMAVIKANAYGHGIAKFASHLRGKVDYLAVANISEAIIVRKVNEDTPVLVLGPVVDEDEFFIADEISVDLSLTSWEQYLKLKKINLNNVKFHLKIDTGMNRLGIRYEEIDKILEVYNYLKENKYLRGIYTHFSTSNTDLEYLNIQLDRFKAILSKLDTNNIIVHAANSSATLRMPNTWFDMVRVGFILYGVPPFSDIPIQLKRISKLESYVASLKNIKKGESTAYDRRWFAPKDGQIAIIPVGYGDGLSYDLANKATVLINGKEYDVVGSVCMDLICVYIPKEDIGKVKIKDKVQLWGEEIKLEELAKKLGTIPYVLMSRLTNRVERIFRV